MQHVLATMLQIPKAVAAKRVGNILAVTMQQMVKRPVTPIVIMIKNIGTVYSWFTVTHIKRIPPKKLKREKEKILSFRFNTKSNEPAPKEAMRLAP